MKIGFLLVSEGEPRPDHIFDILVVLKEMLHLKLGVQTDTEYDGQLAGWCPRLRCLELAVTNAVYAGDGVPEEVSLEEPFTL